VEIQKNAILVLGTSEMRINDNHKWRKNMRNSTRMLVALVMITLGIVGTVSAGPWVPIVKDGNPLASKHGGAVNLAGVSSVSFAYIRGQVKAATDPTTVELRPDYGAMGTRKELSAMADDRLPIARNDYSWQDQSPIYYNPHMDYYYGFQTYDLETDYGGTWQTPIPQRYDEWTDSSLSWDKDQIALNAWVNKEV
jgi:hypothetical protein